MGRHSAPDDDADLDEAPSAALPTAVATLASGRHAREDGHRPRPAPDTDDRTAEIPLVELARDDRPVPEEVTARVPATAAKPAAPRGAHATRHDLALVMSHGDVRARVLAAVVVPFALYVAVLAVVDKLAVHSLVWVWAPAIAAGVLVGLVLDAGHRRYPAPSPGREQSAAVELG